MKKQISSTFLLNTYQSGMFPMANGPKINEIYWLDPDPRAIFEFDNFHASRSLKRLLRKEPYTVTLNQAFRDVMIACTENREDGTWLNDMLSRGYNDLHKEGHAHSVECWNSNKELMGGIYGVQIGKAFMAESMFSRESNASKVALVYLMAGLKKAGFKLFDVQYANDHLEQFNVVEISKDEYHSRLKKATQEDVSLSESLFSSGSVSSFLQSSTQIS